MDTDAKMLKELGNAVTDLQIKYRSSTLTERFEIKPVLIEAMDDYLVYQIKLLKEGIVTKDEDLDEMKKIKKEIDKAATKQKILAAIGKLIAFIALRI